MSLRSGALKPRRLTCVLIATAVVAAAFLGVCVWQATHDAVPAWWRILLVVAVVTVGEAPMLSVRLGHQGHAWTLGEASMAVGLCLLPVGWLAPTVGVAATASYLLSRVPLKKAAFNGGTSVTAAAMAGFVVLGAGGPFHRPGVVELAWVGLATLIYCAWSFLAVGTVVSAASGRRLGETLGQGIGVSVLTSCVNVLVGLGVVVLARISMVTLLALPPVLLALFLAYRAHLRSSEQRDVWRQLNAAGDELAALDEGLIIDLAAARARQLFRPDDARLILDGDAAVEPTTPGRRVSRAAAPLTGSAGSVGTLELVFDEPVAWSDHDQQVLGAFAHTVASALWNARLYQEATRQAAEKARDAETDALTGLGNRRMLLERGAALLEEATGSGGRVGLLLIDLDRFKEVNDTLGHPAGDRLLQGVAARLLQCVRGGDLVVRLGGDEFAILVRNITDGGGAERIAAQIADMLSQPLSFDDLTLAVEGSVGIACLPEDGTTIDELLQHADVAMYQAKAQTTGRWQRYRSDRVGTSVDRLTLAGQLRGALRDGDLVLHYQPELNLRTGAIDRVEALIRWEHPTRGLLTPDVFVPAAEQSGLVGEFTWYVLDRALTACAQWRSEGTGPGVAVNLSARNLLDASLPGEIAQLLLRHRLPAEALTLELTETAVMTDPEAADRTLRELRGLGIHLAVDDFGTGFSSLTLLHTFTVDEVKVDRSFIAHLLERRSDAAIVHKTIELAHELDLRVVAEGVETQELLDTLVRLRCDLAQGHFISPALAEDALAAWLADPPKLALASGSGGTVVPLPRWRPPGLH